VRFRRCTKRFLRGNARTREFDAVNDDDAVNDAKEGTERERENATRVLVLRRVIHRKDATTDEARERGKSAKSAAAAWTERNLIERDGRRRSDA
jgi:hypothetical protein